MSYASAKDLDPDLIPVIDITALRNGTGSDVVARALHTASQGLGFIYITGHGIPQDSIVAARASAFDFFRLPEGQKESVRVNSSHRGWISSGQAKMKDDAKADLKESFVWGWEEAEEVPSDGHPLRGNNQWPAVVSAMEQNSMAYFAAAHDVAYHLMRAFALGLDLEEDFFLRSTDKPLSRASYVYYPAQPKDLGSDQFGVGPHTDFGVLTVLCQDDVGGLQVQTVDGEWVQAPPIPGTLIVNVADLLARWTGNAYNSTPHRVVNSSGQERLSLVLAYDPNPETVIDARDVRGADFEDGQEPITCGDYLIWRFGKAFSYKK